MKQSDLFLQNRRIHKARQFIPRSARVLDVGCASGALFRKLSYLQGGVGVDPDLSAPVHLANADLYPGHFPASLATGAFFDVITMLAVLEHLQPNEQDKVARDCFAWLKPAGLAILTVPSPKVDRILKFLRALRLIHAETLEQHYGFDASKTPAIFGAAGFKLQHASKFELGLNNLFVFEKPTGTD